jgi:hypothetical protein
MEIKRILATTALGFVSVGVISTATVFASQSAKPGEVLYPVKQAIESIQKPEPTKEVEESDSVDTDNSEIENEIENEVEIDDQSDDKSDDSNEVEDESDDQDDDQDEDEDEVEKESSKKVEKTEKPEHTEKEESED